MGDEEPNSARARRRMVEVLAGYLLAAPAFVCPGADGATVEDVVVSEYPVASAAGRVPQPAGLATQHPDLADALVEFFTTVTPRRPEINAAPQPHKSVFGNTIEELSSSI